jgi:hypothetical protein
MAQPAQAPRVSPLARVTKGKQDRPLKVVVYGQAGIGKSTFAAGAPSCIFLPTEDGTDQLEVSRLPRPETLADVFASIDALTLESHPYKTLALDTLGGIERLVWADVCRAGNKLDIEAFGYGKGYIAAVDTWRVLLAKLERMQRDKGMHVILVDHAVARTHKMPDADPFQRWRPSVHEKAADLLAGWSDAVLFATEQVVAIERKGKARGTSDGARVLRTNWAATHDAKNRFNLPDPTPLDWKEFRAATLDAAAIRGRCLELLPSIPADKQDAARAAIDGAGDDAGKLAALLNRLQQLTTDTTPATKDEAQ